MLAVMPKKKPEPEPEQRGGRKSFRYVGLPLDVYEAIKAFADADDRTVPGVVKRACREYLDKHKPGAEG